MTFFITVNVPSDVTQYFARIDLLMMFLIAVNVPSEVTLSILLRVID